MRSSKQIAASINTVFASFSKQADKVQEVLIEVSGHMVAHKDPSLGLKVLNSVKATKHAETIAHWLSENTVFTLRDGKPTIVESKWVALTEGFVPNKDGQHNDAAEAHMAELKLVNRWDYVEPKESGDKVESIFDAVAVVEELIASIGKKTVEQAKAAERAKKGLKASAKAMTYEHLDLERYLRAAVEQYKADREIFEAAKGE